MINKEYINKNTVYYTITGSVSYGLNTPESDVDIRGIAVVDNKDFYFGFLDKFEQYDDPDDDTTIYDIRKAFILMADANPNMLELLYTKDEFRKVVHPLFERVLENRDKFLSRNVRFRYTGYAFSQLKRIKTHRGWLLNPPSKKPERSDYGLPAEKILSKDDLNAFYKVMANLFHNTAEYTNLSDSTKEELDKANWVGLVQRQGVPNNCFSEVQKLTGATDQWMNALQKEQAYNNAKRHFDSYTQWKNSRNKKRAALEEKFGYDCKHAMHLVRLMRMGKEILETGKVNVFRDDKEELLHIRNGGWEFDKLEEYAHTMEEKIVSLYNSSLLPKSPNRKFINNMCVEIIEEYLNK